MLSERQLQELLKVFEQRMQGVTDDYIRRMGTHLKDIGTLTDTDIHRLKQLKRVNANIEAIKRQMARAAEASAEDIEKVFRAVAESDSEFAREMFAENHTPGVKADRIKTLSSPIERILKAQLRVTAQEMANLSRTTVIADSYKAAVDVAVQTVQSGITDYQSAIRSALKKAAVDGLRVEYQSGYTRRLDSAIRQNVLDGVRALNRDVLEQLGKEYGADGVEISAHALCAEDHLPYQGRQFSNKEFDRLQNMLDRPFGMWNCKHTIYPIILGVSPPAHSPEELQMYRTNSREQITIDGITMSRYEWSQQQRRIETAVREQKCIAIGAKAAGDDLLRREAQRNINRLQAQYAKISDAAGLYQQPERMSVAGFRKVKTADELKKSTKHAISLDIDELTPCLRKVSTGQLVETTVSKISPTKKDFAKWQFDWTAPEKEGYTVYALRVKGQKAVQGLVATKEMFGYIEVGWAEAAPQNNPYNKLYFSGQKEYNGVGGHLFAEACKQSYDKGYGGVIGFIAKTNLIEYYKKEFGAHVIFGQSMSIESKEAVALILKYYGGGKR